MLNFKITIWELNSKGKEQILKIENFDNRKDAEKFISEYRAYPKPSKIEKNKLYHTMS